MERAKEVGGTFAGRVVDRLRGWPAVSVDPADCGAGLGLTHGARQIAHLHDGDAAELFLTWPVVERMSVALQDCAQVAVDPGSGWVRMRLDSDGDITLLLSLVSVAIKANAPSAPEPAPCPRALAQAV